MKSLLRSFFAHGWHRKIYFTAFAILGEIVVLDNCLPSKTALHDWTYVVLLCLCIIVAPILFIFWSLPVAFIFLNPLFRLGSKLNGAPFHVGDEVRILIGPHKGRLVRIYEIWDSRHQVRVDLNEQARNGVKDVFSFVEVYRERDQDDQ